MTTHALVAIEQNAPAKLAATPVALAAGHINVGAELVSLFADETQEQTKVTKLAEMASTLTTAEFSDGIKKAKDIADTIDAAQGFKKPEGAKGQANYGPKRQLLNARMSEAKRVFGVFKQAPDVLKEKGYWPAVNAARQWLEANGKTWDGNTAETADAKKARKQQATEAAAMTATMLEHKQEAGETREAYLARISGIMAENIAKANADTFEKRVKTIEASLRKQFGQDFDALCEACTRILSTGEAPAPEGEGAAPQEESTEEKAPE
jgi:hypothetical protein